MRKLPIIFLVFLTGCGISFRGGPSKAQIKQDNVVDRDLYAAPEK